MKTLCDPLSKHVWLKTRMWQNERPASDLLGLLGVIKKSFLASCRCDPGSLPSLHPHVAWDLHPGTECPRHHRVALLIDHFLFYVIPRWIPAHKILQDTAGVGCLWTETQTRTLNEVMCKYIHWHLILALTTRAGPTHDTTAFMDPSTPGCHWT